MGRPLYTSILRARYAAETKPAEPPKPTYPVVEKWSRWNAFDPDSDEFFDSENAVYEAFLTEEEIAERAQLQQRENARTLAERLMRETEAMREAEADSNSASSSTTVESERPAVSGERTSASHTATVQMEVDVETVTDVMEGDAANRVARNLEDSIAVPESGMREGQPARRQPRRAAAAPEWHLLSDGELIRAAIDVAIPRISVVPVDSRDDTRVSSRSPSPDPPDLVSGLQYLSDSPRPYETAMPPISPIPNTPARVSGVFPSTPPSAGTVDTPSPAPTMTPRILNWGSQPSIMRPWVPESPTPAPRDVVYHMGPRLPATPAPLRY